MILCVAFLFLLYKKVKDYLIHCYEINKKRDESIEEALAAAAKYTEYKQESIQAQQKLENEIQSLREKQDEISAKLAQMQEDQQRRERNKLRDRLLQSYRHYVNKETNPNHSWTRMEAEAFWELFHDYEDVGGNGYIHSVVQPEMNRLTVIDL